MPYDPVHQLQWMEQMVYRQVTAGDTKYWINLDQIAYVQDVGSGSHIQFAAVSDSRSLNLTVDQSPQEFLGVGKGRQGNQRESADPEKILEEIRELSPELADQLGPHIT